MPIPDRMPRRILMVTAVPREARAVRSAWGAPEPDAPGAGPWGIEALPVRNGISADLVVSGVGKASAAGATAWALGRLSGPDRSTLVVNAGVAGSLDPGLRIGTVVAADRSVFADEGSVVPGGGWRSIAQMGFPASLDGDRGVAGEAATLAGLRAAGARGGVIATVSVCSGTDAAAAGVVSRTGAGGVGAVAEAMEGGAVGLVAERFGVGFVEVRGISNTTGDRDAQVWNLDGALRGLAEVLGRWLRE